MKQDGEFCVVECPKCGQRVRSLCSPSALDMPIKEMPKVGQPQCMCENSKPGNIIFLTDGLKCTDCGRDFKYVKGKSEVEVAINDYYDEVLKRVERVGVGGLNPSDYAIHIEKLAKGRTDKAAEILEKKAMEIDLNPAHNPKYTGHAATMRETAKALRGEE